MFHSSVGLFELKLCRPFKRTRKISEPCQRSETSEDEQPAYGQYLTVQGLSSNRLKNNTIRSFGNPSLTIPKRPSPVPEEGEVRADGDDETAPEYMRYLSNLSTVTINNGREFRNVPAYLQQFEMSRRGTMTSTVSRAAARRRMSVQHDATPQPTPQDPEKPKNKVKKAMQAVLSKHRVIGLRHIVLALILALYAICGMFIFFSIEGPYERKNTVETREAMNEAFEILASDLKVAASFPNANMSLLLKKAYITLMKIDGKYVGSTFYKLEERDYPLWTWTYGSAFFFSFTLYSTVGYGSISPSTDWGRAATILYTAIGFPVALVIIRDIGSVLLVYITRFYAKVIIKIRITRGYSSSITRESIMLPMKVALLLSFTYVVLTSLFIMTYDSLLGPEPGLDLFHAFYFAFLSYAAVGLGDVMPVNYAHSPVVALVFLTGFPLMRVINRVLYVGIENGMYGSVAYMEDSIDKVAPEKKREESVPTVAENVENGNNLATLDEDNSGGEEDEEDIRIHNELMNNFTIRSAASIALQNQENDQHQHNK